MSYYNTCIVTTHCSSPFVELLFFSVVVAYAVVVEAVDPWTLVIRVILWRVVIAYAIHIVTAASVKDSEDDADNDDSDDDAYSRDNVRCSCQFACTLWFSSHRVTCHRCTSTYLTGVTAVLLTSKIEAVAVPMGGQGDSVPSPLPPLPNEQTGCEVAGFEDKNRTEWKFVKITNIQKYGSQMQTFTPHSTGFAANSRTTFVLFDFA